jgi:predicted dehydrogenase/threonine dehydrogenase-like Zn-dependent dehydrogenase
LKQVLQNLRTGASEVTEVPCPRASTGQLLIRTRRTLVSAGTERMLVEFGKANWIEKARLQPEKVRMVFDKARTDGLLPTLEAVRNKLDQPLPMGYCNVGEVVALGAGVAGFQVGDRVASNGRHAEMVAVPQNLCAKVPEAVEDDAAAFTVIGAVALQGIRLVQPTLGETVVVSGLGLIGLITVQLLRAHGCRVLGLDFNQQRLELARSFGASVVDLGAERNPVGAAQAFSRGRGVDAVLITASTDSSEPVHQAARMCRKRGRIVLVGVTGTELSRADFYEKELSFQVSCSYGPGRYDPDYEEKGRDYPIGFVRWTEQRNFEAFLDMLAEGRVDVSALISHRFAVADAAAAYAVVGGSEPSLGVLLDYPRAVDTAALRPTVVLSEAAELVGGRAAVSFVGSGNYASSVLMPAFRKTGAALISVASNAGVSGVHAGRKFGFLETTTDLEQVFGDARSTAVVIVTRHDSHAALVLKAIAAGKHVFVEKPLCLTSSELESIEEAARGSGRLLMVGFNRRFAPQVGKLKQLLAGVSGPKAFVMTVNAGAIPAHHWTQDLSTGGGRIVGEACHFIDLLRYLSASPITTWSRSDMSVTTADTATLQLGFADGSIGTIHYFANGSRAFPKERLEVFANGGVLQLDNFRRLTGFGWPGFTRLNLWRQDKGQNACAAAFVRAIEEGGPSPIPLEELLEVSRVAIDIGSGRADSGVR